MLQDVRYAWRSLSATPPLSFTAIAVGLAAAPVPSLRAARVDPLVALRASQPRSDLSLLTVYFFSNPHAMRSPDAPAGSVA